VTAYRKRAAILAAAAAVYALAAWMVAPGFYDGFGPQQPYNWTCPPPQAGANIKPSSGHLDIKVIGGVSDASDAFTNDGQVVIGFLPGAFDSIGKTSISVDITPAGSCPNPQGVKLVTNVYRITANASLKQAANLEIVFSNLLPAPTNIYIADDANGPYRLIESQPTRPFVLQAKTSSFGYFAAGYSSASPPPGAVTVGGGQLLPIIVAVLIVLVVLAGVPLAVMRRRRSGGADDEEEDEEEEDGDEDTT
jgi:hypothetical protein